MSPENNTSLPPLECRMVHAPTEALGEALEKGDLSAATELIEKDSADVNASGAHGPFIILSCLKGNVEAVRLLIKHGANCNAGMKDGLPGLFVIAASAAMKLKLHSKDEDATKIIDCFEIMIASGADPNVPAPGGFTCLHVAAEVGNERMILSLLNSGANVKAVNADGQSPAALAASWGHRDIAELLLRYEASMQKSDGEKTVTIEELMVQVQAKEAENRQMLAQHKQDENKDKTHAARVLIPEPEVKDEAKSKDLQRQGDVALVMGKPEEALEKYHEALNHWTLSEKLWSDTAAAAIRLGKYEEALKNARVARTLDKQSVKAWYREGQAAEHLELWDEAAAAYFEAYLLKPEGIEDKEPTIDFGELVKTAVAKGKAAQLVASSMSPKD